MHTFIPPTTTLSPNWSPVDCKIAELWVESPLTGPGATAGGGASSSTFFSFSAICLVSDSAAYESGLETRSEIMYEQFLYWK